MKNTSFSLRENITEILAIISFSMSFVFLFFLLFKPIPVANAEIVNVSVGFIIGAIVQGVTGYYFGASKKRDIIPEAGQSVTIEQKTTTASDDSK